MCENRANFSRVRRSLRFAMPIVVGDRKVNNLWVNTFTENKIGYMTKMSSIWYNIRSRCITNGAYQEGKPTYYGCKLSDNFKNFQYFANWYSSQVGYSSNYNLDKDILVYGNKIYGENTCVLVPLELNMFFSGLVREKLTLGTCFQKASGKYISQISIGGVNTYLGLFKSEKEARDCYITAKEKEASSWYYRLKNKEFIVDKRIIEKLRTFKIEEINV